MKKIVKSFLVLGLVASFANAGEVLTGATRLACEAILCLSSSEKPSECSPSLNKYFSINAKKLKDTIKKRKAFLQLCPVGEAAENDKEFTRLRDDILAYIENPCDLNALNSNIEYKGHENCGERRCITIPEYARVSKKLDKSCRLLMSSKYTNIRPKNICDDKFYAIEDWNKGRVLTKISKSEYDKLPDSQKSSLMPDSENEQIAKWLKNNPQWASRFIQYYKVEKINKNCWVSEE